MSFGQSSRVLQSSLLNSVLLCVMCVFHSALSNLDYVTLHGKRIKVTSSKHSVVQLPKEGTLVSIVTALLSHMLPRSEAQRSYRLSAD